MTWLRRPRAEAEATRKVLATVIETAVIETAAAIEVRAEGVAAAGLGVRATFNASQRRALLRLTRANGEPLKAP